MARYVFPAVFEPEDDRYNVIFPDLPDCYTCGDDIADAMTMAQDILADVLADKEECGETIPAPSALSDHTASEGGFVSLILADTDAWRRSHNTKSVKKTLTIPQWLDVAATARNVNFSQVLQDALRARLGV